MQSPASMRANVSIMCIGLSIDFRTAGVLERYLSGSRHTELVTIKPVYIPCLANCRYELRH